MGAGHRKDQAMMRRSFGAFSPISHAPERGEGPETELVIGDACMVKPPSKSQKSEVGDQVGV